MSQMLINIGSSPNDGTGDQLRTSFDKCNLNFTELYQGQTASLPIGNAIEYRFNVATTEPPASGEIRFDHAQASATKLWASQTTLSGINIKQFLSAATTGSRIIIQDKNDNTNYVKLNVSGSPVDKTPYWEFPVSVTASGGNLPGASVLVTVTALGTSVTPSDTLPLVDGTAAPGTSALYSRGDHAHPTDATRAALTQVIRYDTAQTLTENSGTTLGQRGQARSNIAAAPIDALSYSGMQVNGSMEVSQENGNSTVVIGGANKYIVDGWRVQSLGAQVLASVQAGATTSGYRNGLSTWVNTANAAPAAGDIAFIIQTIEGYRIARLGWGSTGAQAITIAFWVNAVRPGNYSGAVRNGAANRSFVFAFTINASNTWEYKTITVPGDTTGTWATDNTAGLNINFSLLSGSTYQTTPNAWTAGNFTAATGTVNGIAATSDSFEITGVVVLPGIEAPSAARSPLIMRPYDQELLTCRRYFNQWGGSSPFEKLGIGSANTATNCVMPLYTGIPLRTTPTITVSAPGDWAWLTVGNAITAFSIDSFSPQNITVGVTSSGLTVGYSYLIQANNNINARFKLDARL